MFNSAAGGYIGWLAYGQSKTGNILFTVYLTQHLASAGIVSYSVHPGCKFELPQQSYCGVTEIFAAIWTGLSRNLDDSGNETMSKN